MSNKAYDIYKCVHCGNVVKIDELTSIRCFKCNYKGLEPLDTFTDMGTMSYNPSKDVLIRNLVDLYDDYIAHELEPTFRGFISYLRGQL